MGYEISLVNLYQHFKKNVEKCKRVSHKWGQVLLLYNFCYNYIYWVAMEITFFLWVTIKTEKTQDWTTRNDTEDEIKCDWGRWMKKALLNIRVDSDGGS